MFLALRKALIAIVLFGLFVVPCAAQQTEEERGPSTPEERAKVVKLTRQLERDPLGKDAKDARQWLTVWLIHVPDIVVRPCGTLLGPVVNAGAKDDYSAELQSQMMYAQAALVIEDPEAAKDLHSLYVASVESALKTYEAILKKKPAARRPYLDDLLAKRDKGEIHAYVKQAMAGCR
jgi:hypothetical protein